MHNDVLAVAFALASALVIAWGTVVRHRISRRGNQNGSLRDSPIVTALTSPLWWAGMSTAILGYLLEATALAFGTLLVVQPTLVLSLLFTLVLSARMSRRRMTRHETVWAIILTAGVAVVVTLGKPLPGDVDPPADRWMGAFIVGCLALGTITWIATYLHGPRRALALGIVCGALFGYVAVLSKAFIDVVVHHGPGAALVAWETYGMIAGAVLGTVVQQYSFNSGELRHSLPAMSVSTPLVALTVGMIVLREHFQIDSVAGWVVMAVAISAMTAGTIQLSRRQE
ncbi:DMT family transporter [Corynebacterium uterequi]|uniref:DMT family transporter n=1 Tax=Corynebacterium uterequi TaxID=1072256 RepID=UPI000640C0C8|nr:DMT family transporter [Corynebacterium uterequi]